jgi:hypothetical protein
VSNPIARIPKIFVGLVVHPCLTARFQETAKIAACDVQEWPHDFASAWINSAEARHSGPANQLQQESLCLIVTRVPDGDPIGRCGLGHPVKEVVPQTTRGVLDGEPLRLCIRGNIH